MPHSDIAVVLTLGHNRFLREAAGHATMLSLFRMSTYHLWEKFLKYCSKRIPCAYFLVLAQAHSTLANQSFLR